MIRMIRMILALILGSVLRKCVLVLDVIYSNARLR